MRLVKEELGVKTALGVSNISFGLPSRQLMNQTFLTMAMMPFTYNISYGIAFGLISYVAIKALSGKIKEIHAATWIISILFALTFFLTH